MFSKDHYDELRLLIGSFLASKMIGKLVAWKTQNPTATDQEMKDKTYEFLPAVMKDIRSTLPTELADFFDQDIEHFRNQILSRLN